MCPLSPLLTQKTGTTSPQLCIPAAWRPGRGQLPGEPTRESPQPVLPRDTGTERHHHAAACPPRQPSRFRHHPSSQKRDETTFQLQSERTRAIACTWEGRDVTKRRADMHHSPGRASGAPHGALDPRAPPCICPQTGTHVRALSPAGLTYLVRKPLSPLPGDAGSASRRCGEAV